MAARGKRGGEGYFGRTDYVNGESRHFDLAIFLQETSEIHAFRL
jgi:hypothetical protein